MNTCMSRVSARQRLNFYMSPLIDLSYTTTLALQLSEHSRRLGHYSFLYFGNVSWCKHFMFCEVFHSLCQKLSLCSLSSTEGTHKKKTKTKTVCRPRPEGGNWETEEQVLNRLMKLLPLEAFSSHNAEKVLKFLRPGIFRQTPRWKSMSEELQMQRRRVDMAAELPWALQWKKKKNTTQRWVTKKHHCFILNHIRKKTNTF